MTKLLACSLGGGMGGNITLTFARTSSPDDGQRHFPPATPKLSQGHYQRRDDRPAAALLPDGGLQHGYGATSVRRCRRPAVLDEGHVLFPQCQQGSPAFEGQSNAPRSPTKGYISLIVPIILKRIY